MKTIRKHSRIQVSIKHLPPAVAAGFTILVSSVTTPIHAQANETSQMILEEVVVTARKREEDIQSVPVAVTALGSEAIREKNVENPYDLTFHVPGLVVRQGQANRGQPDYFIRGQGASYGTPAGVVVYFNEVPLKPTGAAGSTVQFFDLASVQVLKGPQGTLFGRSSTGGAVLYAPQKPRDEPEGYLDIKLGNYDLQETTGVANLPLVEGVLSARAAVNIQRRDGFTQSRSTGQWLDSRERESYRLGINFTPTDWLESYTLLQQNNVDETPTGAVLMAINDDLGMFNTSPGTGAGWEAAAGLCGAIAPAGMARQACIDERIGRIDSLVQDLRDERDRVAGGGSVRRNLTAEMNHSRGRNQQIFNITTVDIGHYSLFGDVSIKNIFAVNRNRVSNIVREFGATRYPHGITYAAGYDLAGTPSRPYRPREFGRTSFSDDLVEEFQIIGDMEGGHSWILGYFTERVKAPYDRVPIFPNFNNAFSVPLDNLTFLNPVDSKTRNEQSGIFGQITLDLSTIAAEGLSLTAGYRRTKSELTQTSVPIIHGAEGSTLGTTANTLKMDESANSWTLSLDYQINPDTLIYIAHRRGFKPGGINASAVGFENDVPGLKLTYAPETLDDIELGVKADWQLGQTMVRSNLAVYRSWYQDIQRSETLPNPNPPFNVVTQTNNIAKAEISGLELENQLLFNGNIQVMLNYAWTDARNTRWPGTTTAIDGTVYANSKSPYVGVAEHQGTVGLRYLAPLDPALGQLSFYAEYYRQSGIWLDDTALASFPDKFGYQPGYDNVNLRIDWANVLGKPLDLSVFVRNALNDEWLVGSNSLITALGIQTGTYNEPRTYGLQLRYRFGEDNGH